MATSSFNMLLSHVLNLELLTMLATFASCFLSWLAPQTFSAPHHVTHPEPSPNLPAQKVNK